MTDNKDIPDSEKMTGEPMKQASLDLKVLREARGLSLRDIYKQTRVSVVNLEAIETEQFHLLPSPAYAKTFINAYAEAIGIDGKILLDAYDNYLQSINIEEELEKNRRKATRKNRRHRYLIIGCVLLIIIVVGVMLALFLHNQSELAILRGETPQTIEQKTDTKFVGSAKPDTPLVAAEQADQANPEIKAQGGQVMTDPTPLLPSREMKKGAAAPAAAGREIAAPSESDQKANPEKTYRLVIEARELTWIRIKADHHQSQMILKPGQKIERFASELFVVDVGNAAGIDLTFQGRSMGMLGKQGQVVHLILP